MAKKPDWIENLAEEVRRHIKDRKYRLSRHVLDRLSERSIDWPDLMFVLQNGWHEKEKTVFSNARQSWNYAVRGRTSDGMELRAIVTFDRGMIVITAIRLSKKGEK